MKMRPFINRHVMAVIENEWAQLRRNKIVIFTTIVPPILLVMVALSVLFLTTLLDLDLSKVAKGTPANMLGGSGSAVPGLSPADQVRATLLSPFLILFQMIPLVVPITIASYSIIGEKQSRSLEALLATPIRTWELLLGKALAAVLPGIIATWWTYVLFATAARFAVSDAVYTNIIVGPTWVLAVVLLTPLFSFLAVGCAIIISSRVKDPQSAQQLGSLVVLPLIGVLVAQVTGAVTLGLGSVLGTALLIGLVDVVLLGVAVRLFSRETILMNWR
jgi:ABC-2 type transport system permease protein